MPAGPERWKDPGAVDQVFEDARRRNWRVVGAALADGFPIHARREGTADTTLLQLAALGGHTATIRAVLAHGEDPHDPYALHSAVLCAAQSGTAKALRVLLLESGHAH